MKMPQEYIEDIVDVFIQFKDENGPKYFALEFSDDNDLLYITDTTLK